MFSFQMAVQILEAGPDPLDAQVSQPAYFGHAVV
jgi:hypothetical protein